MKEAFADFGYDRVQVPVVQVAARRSFSLERVTAPPHPSNDTNAKTQPQPKVMDSFNVLYRNQIDFLCAHRHAGSRLVENGSMVVARKGAAS
jgi:hypothetical protein